MGASSGRTSRSARIRGGGTYSGVSFEYVGLGIPNFNSFEEGDTIDKQSVSRSPNYGRMIVSPHGEQGIRGPPTRHRDMWATRHPIEHRGNRVHIWSQDESIIGKFVWEPKKIETPRNPRMEVESLSAFINNALDIDKNEVDIVSEAERRFKGMSQIDILNIINQVKEKRFDPDSIQQELIDEMDEWDNID